MLYKTFKEQLEEYYNLRSGDKVYLDDATFIVLKEYLSTLNGKELDDELIFIIDRWWVIKNNRDIKLLLQETYRKELLLISKNAVRHRDKDVKIN